MKNGQVFQRHFSGSTLQFEIWETVFCCLAFSNTGSVDADLNIYHCLGSQKAFPFIWF